MSNTKLTNQRKILFSSKVKTWFLKWKYGSKIQTKNFVQILGGLPSIKVPGTSKIMLGNMVVINSDKSNSNTALTNNCTLVCGLKGIIEIGDNTQLNGVSITAYEHVKIGKNCQIASSTFISDTDFHPINPTEREKECLGYKIDHSKVSKKPISIGDNVWIGWGVTILKGVSIGNNSIVAAGSVVLTDVPENVIVGGNPAIIKKQLI